MRPGAALWTPRAVVVQGWERPPAHPTQLLSTSLQLLALSPNFVLGIGHFLPLPHPFYAQLYPSLYLLVFLWQQL